jgi:hypothetical protein
VIERMRITARLGLRACRLKGKRRQHPIAYFDMAAQWRRMAEQQQAIGDVLGDRRNRET